jgi:hypothetical protein
MKEETVEDVLRQVRAMLLTRKVLPKSNTRWVFEVIIGPPDDHFITVYGDGNEGLSENGKTLLEAAQKLRTACVERVSKDFSRRLQDTLGCAVRCLKLKRSTDPIALCANGLNERRFVPSQSSYISLKGSTRSSRAPDPKVTRTLFR